MVIFCPVLSVECDRLKCEFKIQLLGKIYSGFRKGNCEDLEVLKPVGARLSDSNIHRNSNI